LAGIFFPWSYGFIPGILTINEQGKKPQIKKINTKLWYGF